MTKKHFEALADALANCRPLPTDHEGMSYWDDSVSAVADVCESTNERFDRTKFVRACNER